MLNYITSKNILSIVLWHSALLTSLHMSAHTIIQWRTRNYNHKYMNNSHMLFSFSFSLMFRYVPLILPFPPTLPLFLYLRYFLFTLFHIFGLALSSVLPTLFDFTVLAASRLLWRDLVNTVHHSVMFSLSSSTYKTHPNSPHGPTDLRPLILKCSLL